MDETKAFTLINIEDKVSPAILASLLNRNVSLMYQWAQIGRLPDFKNGTYNYRECIDHLTTSLLRAEEVKLAKHQEKVKEKEAKSNRNSYNANEFGDVEDSMHPLMAAKIQQNIKTEAAREAQLWQAIAIKNEEYVDFAKKLSIVEPFIVQIRDLLLGIALDFPETQEVVDEGMENLYNMGIKLTEEAKIDRDSYVEAMLNRSIKEIEAADNG